MPFGFPHRDIAGLTLRLAVALILVALAHSSFAIAQTEEMQILDSVKELQKQLESASYDERDQAENEIIKLGIDALDYISDPSDEYTADLNERLVRIRKQLEKVAISKAISPTTINVSGTLSLKAALAKIKRQTGNVIALADGYDPAVLEQKISLELVDASFWKALAEITARGGVEVQTYSGLSNQTTIVPKAPVDPTLVDKAITEIPIPTDESGIFRIRATKVVSSTNLLQPQTDYTMLTLEVQWEPRLTPISVDLPLESVKIVDADGNAIELSDSKGTLSGRVQSGINQIEIPLTLQRLNTRYQNHWLSNGETRMCSTRATREISFWEAGGSCWRTRAVARWSHCSVSGI